MKRKLITTLVALRRLLSAARESRILTITGTPRKPSLPLMAPPPFPSLLPRSPTASTMFPSPYPALPLILMAQENPEPLTLSNFSTNLSTRKVGSKLTPNKTTRKTSILLAGVLIGSLPRKDITILRQKLPTGRKILRMDRPSKMSLMIQPLPRLRWPTPKREIIQATSR